MWNEHVNKIVIIIIIVTDCWIDIRIKLNSMGDDSPHRVAQAQFGAKVHSARHIHLIFHFSHEMALSKFDPKISSTQGSSKTGEWGSLPLLQNFQSEVQLTLFFYKYKQSHLFWRNIHILCFLFSLLFFRSFCHNQFKFFNFFSIFSVCFLLLLFLNWKNKFTNPEIVNHC